MHVRKSLAARKLALVAGFMKRKCWPALGDPLDSMTSNGSPMRLRPKVAGLLTVADERMKRGFEPYRAQLRFNLRITWFRWDPKIPR